MAGAQSPQSRVLITRGNQPGYRGKFKKLENKKFSKNTSTCVLAAHSVWIGNDARIYRTGRWTLKAGKMAHARPPSQVGVPMGSRWK